MPNSNSLTSRIHKWLRINYDGLFVLREFSADAKSALGQLLGAIQQFVLPVKERRPRQTFVPHIESLETRYVPSSYTWTGGGGNNHWSNTGNWNGGAVVTYPHFLADDVTISSGTVDLDVVVSINSIAMSGGSLNLAGGGLTLNGGTSTFTGGTINSGITFNSGTVLDWNGGTLASVLTDYGVLNFTSGTISSEVDNFGVMSLLQTSTLTISGGSSGILNENSVVYSGSGDIDLAGNAFLYNTGGAVFDLQSDTSIYSGDGTGIFRNPESTIQKSAGTGVSDFNIDMPDVGFVNVLSGGITFSGRTLHAHDVATDTITGAVIDGATVTVDSTLTVDSIVFSSGKFNGGGDLTFAGTSSWTEGRIETASVTVGSSATLNISTSGSKQLGSGIGITLFNNDGTLNWTQGDIGLSGMVNVGNSGDWTMAAGLNLTGGSLATQFFYNAGTLTVAGVGTAGVNNFAVNFTQASSGILFVELRELEGGKFDHLKIAGTASLNGQIKARALSGVLISGSDVFPVLTASFVTGTFSSTDIGSFGTGITLAPTYDDTDANLAVVGPSLTVQSGANLSGNNHVEVAAARDYSSLFEEDTLYYYAGLEYNSDTADPQPLIGISLPTSPLDPLPTQVKATLTWGSNSPQATVPFGIPMSAVAGNPLNFTLQADTPVSSQVLYEFTVDLEVDYAGASPVYFHLGGHTFVVVNGATPYGKGWAATDDNTLVYAGGNAYLVYANGGYTEYTDDGTFLKNSTDLGTSKIGALSGSTITLPNGTTWNYGAGGGKLASVVDAGGVSVTFSYSGTGLSQVMDQDGNWDQYDYDGNGQIAHIIRHVVDEHGGNVTYTTTTVGDGTNLVSVTDDLGNIRSFTYDAHSKMLTDSGTGATYTYIDGALSKTTYGSVTSTLVPQLMQGYGSSTTVSPTAVAGDAYAANTNANGDTTKSYYNSAGQLTQLTLPSGASESSTYDKYGNPLTQTDLDGNVTTMTYVPGTSNLASQVAPDGFTTGYAYGSSTDQPTTVTDEFGQTTSYAYDSSGDLTQSTNPDGSTTKFTYSADLPRTEVDADGGTTTFAYDSHRRLTQIVDPLGQTTTIDYNVVTATVTIQTPDGLTSTITYNGDGQVASQTDANGNNNIPLYSDRGLETATVNPLGQTSYQLYDSGNLPTATINAAGATTLQIYDSSGRVTATVNANGKTSYQFYDASGQVTATVDALNHTTQQRYDLAGHVTATIDALGQTSLQEYSSSGLLTASVDALGRTTTYAYDAHRRLTATVNALGYTSLQNYDSFGHVTAMVDFAGHTSYQYFDLGDRVTAAVNALGQTSSTQYDAMGQATASIDALGHTTRTIYDLAGHATASVDALGKTSYTLYDAMGRATATVNANGATSRQIYDAAGQPTASVDFNGHTSYTRYDAAGEVTATIDALGRTWQTRYDAAGHATASIDPLGATSYTLYDAEGQATATINANGATSYTVYDADGQVTATINALGRTSYTAYDADGRATAFIDANGATSYTRYDADGEVTASIDANGHTASTSYDAIGRATASIDALGHTAITSYDPDGNVTAYIDRNGHTTSTAYDAIGEPTASVDALGHTSFTAYDAVGDVTQMVNANGQTTRNFYDADNRLTQMIDNAGRTAHLAYDNLGRTTQTIDVHGYTTLQYYDAVGNATEVVNAAGAAAFTSFDAADEPTLAIDGNGNTTRQLYDADGRLTANVDGNGYTSQTRYDAIGQVTATVDGAGTTNQYRYDPAGDRTAVIDPDGNTTTFAFDAVGRVTQTITPTSGTTTQVYDPAGNVTETIAADGSSIVTAYDADDRQTLQTWYDHLGSVVDTQHRSYNDGGLLTSASNTNGTYSYSYDSADRVTQVAEPFGATLNYAYDNIGNQTQVIDSYGGTQTSSYDLENRLTSRTYSGQGQHLREDYLYGPLNLVATKKRYSDLAGTTLVGSSDYAYDGDQQVTSIIDYDGSHNVLNNFAYTYDPAGNLGTQTENGDFTYFLYDHANQLTLSGFLPSGSLTYITTNYGYDAAGNRNTGGSTPTTGNQLSTDGTWNYTYDAKGNVTEKDSVSTAEKWTYAYNNANELVETKHYNASNTLVMTADYKYDIFGNRVEKDVTTTGTVVTRYAYDMWNPVKAGALGTSGSDIWAVLNGSSSLTTRELQGDGIDDHLAYTTSGGNAFWLLSDHLGSIRTVVDSTGSAVNTYTYDAFGNVTSPSSPTMYAWTGRELDAETGMQYNRARYYDPTTGRWISLDPMGFDAGDSNLYRYVKNSATNASDPSGKIEFSVWERAGDLAGKYYVWATVTVAFTFKDSPVSKWTPEREKRFAELFALRVPEVWNGDTVAIKSVGAKRQTENTRIGVLNHPLSGLGPRLKDVKYYYYERYYPRLEVKVVNDGSRVDYKIEVLANEKGELITSHAEVGPTPGVGRTVAFLDEADVEERNTSLWYYQLPAAHEFGHLLGNQHPGGYFTTYAADPSSLMGAGSELRPAYFAKWVQWLDSNYPAEKPFKAYYARNLIYVAR